MNDNHSRKFDEIKRHLLFSVAFNVVVLIIGVVGYTWIEGWNLLDSVYMTVITLASVGYEETHALSDDGRILTIGLIMLGVAALGNLVSQLAQALSQGYFTERLYTHRRIRMLSRLSNHHIVCGFGRMGQHICQDLAEERASFAIIDKENAKVLLARDLGFLAIQGDASRDAVLEEAGIRQAKSVICALPSDAETIYVVLSVKSLRPEVYTIARASNEEAITKLTRVGADKIVSPYLTGAKRMAALALRPQIVDLFEATSFGSERIFIEEIRLPAASVSPFVGKTLRELDLRNQARVLVLAIRRREGDFIGTPAGTALLLEGDLLICMGKQEDLKRLNGLLLPNRPESPPS